MLIIHTKFLMNETSTLGKLVSLKSRSRKKKKYDLLDEFYRNWPHLISDSDLFILYFWGNSDHIKILILFFCIGLWLKSAINPHINNSESRIRYMRTCRVLRPLNKVEFHYFFKLAVEFFAMDTAVYFYDIFTTKKERNYYANMLKSTSLIDFFLKKPQKWQQTCARKLLLIFTRKTIHGMLRMWKMLDHPSRN